MLRSTKPGPTVLRFPVRGDEESPLYDEFGNEDCIGINPGVAGIVVVTVTVTVGAVATIWVVKRLVVLIYDVVDEDVRVVLTTGAVELYVWLIVTVWVARGVIVVSAVYVVVEVQQGV